MANTKYNEVNVDEERIDLTSKQSGKRNRSQTQESSSKNKMKILFTSIFLLAIVAGSAVFFISFRSSSAKKIVVENNSNDEMVFDNSKNEKEAQESISSHDYNNNDDRRRRPKLRSHIGYNTHPSVGSIGHVNIYIKEDKTKPYERFQFPAARFGRNRNPLRGPFLSYTRRVPIYADALTKQTVIQSYAGDHLIPALMNAYGELFSVAQLIASGHASLSSIGIEVKGRIDMKRYFYTRRLIGPSVPSINPYTGSFTSAIFTHFGSFLKVKVNKILQHLDYPRVIEREEEEEDDDCNDVIPHAPYGNNGYPSRKKPCQTTQFPKTTTTKKAITTTPPVGAGTTTTLPGGAGTTTTLPGGAGTTTTLPGGAGATTTTLPGGAGTTTTTLPGELGTTTTMPPISSPNQCGSNTKARTPFTLRLFQDEFVNPSEHTTLPKVCRPDGHCMFSYTVDVYDTRLSPFNKVIPECASKPGTIFITYGGHIPGETFIVPTGHESMVRFNNKIGTYFKESFPPCTGTRFGRPIGIHHHGSASAPPYDGWADDETCVNETKEYVYPNNRPGLDWYHDHALHITADNAYFGLAGLYLVSSKLKHGGCGEPWNLEDIEDRLIILQDKALTAECQLAIDTANIDEISFYGDINMVSGIPFPRMPLDAKTYRFRILNAAVSRPYLLFFKNEALQDIGSQICKIIATDGGFRAQPVTFPVNGLLIGVAERFEIVCDFTQLKGQTLYMWNGFDDKWMKHVVYFCYSHLIAKLEISSTTPNGAPQFDESLTTPEPERPIQRVLEAADIAEAKRMAANDQFHRQMVFGRRNDQWVINGETWDTFKIAAADVGQNTWELWKFKTGGGWFHPVHVHLVDFYIIKRDRDGGLKSYEEMSPKDVIYLGPSQEIWTIIRFGPHKGDYMFHCHNLIHEDNDMMRAFRVIDSEQGRTASTAERFIRNGFAKIVYSNWKYTDPMLTEVAAKPTSQMATFDDAYKKNMLDINVYRIFYPRDETDVPLNGFTNPWRAKFCPIRN